MTTTQTRKAHSPMDISWAVSAAVLTLVTVAGVAALAYAVAALFIPGLLK